VHKLKITCYLHQHHSVLCQKPAQNITKHNNTWTHSNKHKHMHHWITTGSNSNGMIHHIVLNITTLKTPCSVSILR